MTKALIRKSIFQIQLAKWRIRLWFRRSETVNGVLTENPISILTISEAVQEFFDRQTARYQMENFYVPTLDEMGLRIEGAFCHLGLATYEIWDTLLIGEVRYIDANQPEH